MSKAQRMLDRSGWTLETAMPGTMIQVTARALNIETAMTSSSLRAGRHNANPYSSNNWETAVRGTVLIIMSVAPIVRGAYHGVMQYYINVITPTGRVGRVVHTTQLHNNSGSKSLKSTWCKPLKSRAMFAKSTTP